MAIGSMTTNSTVDMIDKTLKTENAPADAAAVGNIILDNTKETPQPIFYSKAEVDKLLEDCKEAAKRAALLAANPVGKLWASDDPTSPASIVGGTWEQIKDKFILAAGDTYAAGSTGGEAAHIVTVGEMPRHDHIEYMPVQGYEDWDEYTTSSYDVAISINSTHNNYFHPGEKIRVTYVGSCGTATAAVGDGTAHNNMPPYVAMYVWKRIA